MNKERKLKIRMSYPTNPLSFDIVVSRQMFNEAVKRLLDLSHVGSIWIVDKRGTYHNLNMVQSMHVLEEFED